MVATDVASRGLDVSDIEAVIQYDMAATAEDYVHRIGRTARADRKGQSFTLFTEEDSRLSGALVDILQRAEQEIPSKLREMSTWPRKGNPNQGRRYNSQSGFWGGEEEDQGSLDTSSAFGGGGSFADRFGR